MSKQAKRYQHSEEFDRLDLDRGKEARERSRRMAAKAADLRRYSGDDEQADRLQHRANKWATVAARFGAVAILAGLMLVGFAQPTRADSGEPKPVTYGFDPCSTLAYDMATHDRPYSVRAFEKHMHVIGCEQADSGKWELESLPSAHGCDSAAYLIALFYINLSGKPILTLRPDTIGRELDRKHHKMDCALDGQTWRWS
jgi:hypothetical protein